MKKGHERECRAIGKLISILALLCAADEHKITDLLTGYLWDEEEAGMIKREIDDPKKFLDTID